MPDIAQLRTVLRNKEIDADDNTITDIDNNEIKAAAAIDYSKLNLAGSIVNADIAIAAAIAYSKLALTNSIVDADIAASGITTRSKLPSPLVYDDEPNTYGDFTQRFRSGKLEVRNPADTFSHIITGVAITADRILNLPLSTGTDTLMSLNANQSVLVAKTFIDNTLLLFNPAFSARYNVRTSAITANRDITMPLLTANDAFVFENHIQNMNNKTFLSSGLKVRNPADTFSYSFVGGAITADRNVTLPPVASNDTFMLLTHDAAVTGEKRFLNSMLAILNPANTFKYIFKSAALAANRDVNLPLLTANDTFVFEAHAQALSNKELGAGTSVADGQNIALGTTTGSKIGTGTTQKMGFFNATPVSQRTNIADPTGGATQDAEARTAISAILTRLEELGFFAAS